MEYLVLMVAVIIIFAMVLLYLRWLRKWTWRLLALLGWALFLAGFVGVAASSYGFIGGDESLWLIPVALGAVLAVAVHILNNRMIGRMISESQGTPPQG